MARVRLLAEDVLAGAERTHRPLVMEAVRKRDVDRLDLGIVEQRLVRAVCSRQPVLARVLLGAGGVAARNCDRLHASPAKRFEDLQVDPRRREEAEPERRHEEPISPEPRRTSVVGTHDGLREPVAAGEPSTLAS